MKKWKKESDYQAYLKKEIERRLPGSYILKNDPTFVQGIPDLIVLHGERWATLEVKRSKDEPHRPNQDWYVDDMSTKSFSAFIFPENEKEVLDGLEQSLKSSR